MKRLWPFALFIGLFVNNALLLSACSNPTPAATATLEPSVTFTPALPTAPPSATLTPEPPTATPTITPSPTATFTPSPTPTATREPEQLMGLALHPNGQTLAVVTTWQVRLYDLTTQHWGLTIDPQFTQLHRAAWAPDASALLLAGQVSDPANPANSASTLQLWDFTTNAPRWTVVPDTGGLNALAWSPDGTQIAVAGLQVAILAVDSGNTLNAQGNFSGTLSVAWSADSTRLIAAPDIENAIRLWRWDNNGKTAVRLYDARLANRAIAWAPNGDNIASVGVETFSRPVVAIWSFETRRVQQIVSGFQTAGFTHIAWSPDNRRLAAWGSADATLWRRTNPDRKVVIAPAENNQLRDLVWSANSAQVFTVEAYAVKIWDAARGTLLNTLAP